MTDEEKKAIEYVKNIKNWWWNNSPDRIYSINKTDIEQFDIVLNLIEELNWQVNEQKTLLKYKTDRIEELKEELEIYKIYTKQEDLQDFDLFIKQNYVSKDEYKKAIETTFEVCNKHWIDKIKAKIEELDYNDFSNFERRCKQEILQSLLDKE